MSNESTDHELSIEQLAVVFHEPYFRLGVKKSQEEQKKTQSGYILQVVACPGSGKTFCIVQRIAFLISKGVRLNQILVLAFNHDAANRIKEALSLCHPSWPSQICCGTFHSIAKRILMQYGVWRDEPFHVDETQYRWCEWLRCTLPYRFFEHVLVDETQDINQVQHEIIRLLSKTCICLTLVGDPDQNIYKFRGSDSKFMEQILSNENNESLNKVTRTKLTVNYRSTWQIIRLANAILQVLNTLNSSTNDKSRDDDDDPRFESPDESEDVEDDSWQSAGECFQMVAYKDEEEEDPTPYHKVSMNLATMLKGICSRIKLIPKETRYDVCVLARNNFLLQKFAKVCQRERLPYRFCQPSSSKGNEYLLQQLKQNQKQQDEEKEAQEDGITLEEQREKANLLQQEQIVLSTIFCAKGGEWKYVFLIGLHNLYFPDRRSDILSEWRLFYVAVTRCKYYLELHNNAMFPSDFISWLDPTLIYHDSRNKGIIEYAKIRRNGYTPFLSIPHSQQQQQQQQKQRGPPRGPTIAAYSSWDDMQPCPPSHEKKKKKNQVAQAVERPNKPYLLASKMKYLNGADYIFLKNNCLPNLDGFVNPVFLPSSTTGRKSRLFVNAVRLNPWTELASRMQTTLGLHLQPFLILFSRRILHEVAHEVGTFTVKDVSKFLSDQKTKSEKAGNLSARLEHRLIFSHIQSCYNQCQDPQCSWNALANDIFQLAQCFFWTQLEHHQGHESTADPCVVLSRKFTNLNLDFIHQVVIPYFTSFISQLNWLFKPAMAFELTLKLDFKIHDCLLDTIPALFLVNRGDKKGVDHQRVDKRVESDIALFLVTGKQYRCSLEELIQMLYLASYSSELSASSESSESSKTSKTFNVVICNVETLQLSYIDLTHWTQKQRFQEFLTKGFR